MLKRFTKLSFTQKIGITIIGISILFLIPIIVFNSSVGRSSTISQTSPIKFEYCGTTPKELCVLSFGRDGAGNAIINFFVPNKKLPNFHLVIKKADSENRYECKKNSEIKTSIFCSGQPLSLKQTIEVNIIANKDDTRLATGTFFIEALLVSTQSTQSVSKEATQLESSSTNENNSLSNTSILTIKNATPTTSALSSYPYP